MNCWSPLYKWQYYKNISQYYIPIFSIEMNCEILMIRHKGYNNPTIQEFSTSISFNKINNQDNCLTKKKTVRNENWTVQIKRNILLRNTDLIPSYLQMKISPLTAFYAYLNIETQSWILCKTENTLMDNTHIATLMHNVYALVESKMVNEIIPNKLKIR